MHHCCRACTLRTRFGTRESKRDGKNMGFICYPSELLISFTFFPSAVMLTPHSPKEKPKWKNGRVFPLKKRCRRTTGSCHWELNTIKWHQLCRFFHICSPELIWVCYLHQLLLLLTYRLGVDSSSENIGWWFLDFINTVVSDKNPPKSKPSSLILILCSWLLSKKSILFGSESCAKITYTHNCFTFITNSNSVITWNPPKSSF